MKNRLLACSLILLGAHCPSTGEVLAERSPTGFVNDFISQKWDENNIHPAAMTTDREFVRRVYLDLVGRVPTRQERETFISDQRSNKRDALIKLLLKSEDYVQHFADLFDTLLMGRGSDRDYRDRRDHLWRSWLEQVFRENRPWDDVVAEVLLARPETKQERGLVWFLYERKDNHQEIAEAISPAFFGIRIECAQCHDHMLATEIEQAHYWGLVAFFNRSKNTKTDFGLGVGESAVGGFSEFANIEGSSSPNHLTFFGSEAVYEKRPDKDQKVEDHADLYQDSTAHGNLRIPKFSRRQNFVEQVVKGNPLIARAFVNRIWALLFGRGIVHPFDEMDSVHEPSHPELLDWLAEDFRRSNFDIRRLIHLVVLSDAYQLASRQPQGADDPALFAWYLERPLTAEQLSRSFQLVLRGKFRNDDPLTSLLRRSFPAVLPETIQTGVQEALFLSNNEEINRFILESDEESHLVKQILNLDSESDQIERLFETLYGRRATIEETRRISQYLESANSEQQELELWQQVVWATITSAEFRYNH